MSDAAIASESGQSTVEFALVAAVCVAIVVALGAFWQAIDRGIFMEHALASASHHLTLSAGGALDVFIY